MGRSGHTRGIFSNLSSFGFSHFLSMLSVGVDELYRQIDFQSLDSRQIPKRFSKVRDAIWMILGH
jgi:hypothetical protein